MIAVNTLQAASEGISFWVAGPELFLVASMVTKYLQFPRLREDHHLELTAKKTKQSSAKESIAAVLPGSFVVSPEHFQHAVNGKPVDRNSGKGRKGRKGPDWKRDARKDRDRHKRNI